MTDNHLLLYRLAELMLEHEQHLLPVDLLFDDRQIGDFVKSIQIDSPYQQMLLEGVLTESVREEKLFVSFTVEGYFHYVLGEVLYERIKKSNFYCLIEIIEKNKLNGLVSGIQQSIIRDIQENNLENLTQLIDSEIQNFGFCALPLSYAFIKNDSSYENTIHGEVKQMDVLSVLLKNPTKNDLKILLEAIHHLEGILKNKLVKQIYNSLINSVKTNSIDALKLLCNCIQHIPIERRINEVDKMIHALETFNDDSNYHDILVELGTQYYLLEKYEKALECYTEAADYLSKSFVENRERLQKIFTNLGAVYWRLNNMDFANKYFKQTYDICLDIYGKNHSITSIANFNLGIIEASLENYPKALVIFNEVLDLDLSSYGKTHITTARTYSNIGSIYLQLKEYESAYSFFKQALDIDTQLLHSSHSSLGLDYDDIGDVYSGLCDFGNAKLYYNKSYEIFVKNNGYEHSHTKLLLNKINELNDL
jgi:tetratricopeptide (TPR) repeat protein